MGKSPISDKQREKLLELVAELRRVIDHVSSINAGEEELEAFRHRTRELADDLQRYAGKKMLEHFNTDVAGDLNNVLPSSPISGRYNPVAPPVEMTHEGAKVIGRVSFGKVYEGPPECVHGSIVAAVYDQLLAAATIVNKLGGPTATLTIDYLKPTPLLEPLVFSAWVDRTDGRKISVAGECRHGEALISRCHGIFIRYMGSNEE